MSLSSLIGIEFAKVRRSKVAPLIFIAPILVVISGVASLGRYLTPEYTNANPAKFSDVQDNPFAKEIAWLEEQGITTGWPDGTFRPGQAIDRDAMAAFIARYMKKFDHVQTVPAH